MIVADFVDKRSPYEFIYGKELGEEHTYPLM